MRRLKFTSSGIALIATILVGGCSASVAPANHASAYGTFVDLFNGYSADYEPADSPAQLAEWSTVVARGKMDSVIPGRVYGTSMDDPGAAREVTLVINAAEILEGRVPNFSGKLYVELPSPGNVPAATFDAAIPRGANVIVYLSPAPNPVQPLIVDEDAGRPPGEPLWQPINPQGLVIAGDDSTFLALDHLELAETSLVDFLPDADRFPYDPDAPHDVP